MNTSIQVISFDLDGTLAEDGFDRALWFQEIPRRYAALHGLSFEAARELVVAEYRALKGHPRWTDMGFWFERFGLGDWRQAVERLRHLIRAYPETLPVLSALQQEYRLIIVTQAQRKFHELKMQALGLDAYIDALYATPDHFGQLAKDAHIYRAIAREQGVLPGQVLHVGDHRLYDYNVPRCVGLRALWLDRGGAARIDGTVRDLWGVVAYLRNQSHYMCV